MLGRTDFDLKIKEYQSLTPEGKALLREQALAMARAERAQAIRAFFRWVISAVAAWEGRRWAALRKWHERRAAIRTLQTFDDRQLKDIGLRRSEITGAVYGYNRDESLRGRGAETAKPELTIRQQSRGNDSRTSPPAAQNRNDRASIRTAA